MSPRRRQILQLVHDSLATTGVSPSIGELADRFGTSGAAIVTHIRGLVADGWLIRRAGLNSKRSLEVVRLPGSGLLAAEIAWCHANPERVRAMIAVTGGLVGTSVGASGFEPAEEIVASIDDLAAQARQLIAQLQPGGAIEIALPSANPARLRAYRRVSLLAIRQWGRGAVRRTSTPTGVRLQLVRADA